MERRDRGAEQAAFVEEICAICQSERVQLVLIAGDVFQNAHPSAAAEQLFFHALDKLAQNGTRAVVVIAGNHDHPDRLCAAQPLAGRHGITLIGYPGAPLEPTPGAAGMARRVTAGPSWAEIVVPGCDHPAVVAALPYPSEGRLRELVSDTLDDADLQRAYNRKVAAVFQTLAGHYRRETVNLAMTHLYVRGGMETGTESQIQTIGGSYAIDPEVFPAQAQYVALGHLHRAQKVGGTAMPVCYAGSPLAYSFAEAGHTKSVTLVEVEPGQRAVVREIPLQAGKPLVLWQAGSPEEVIRDLEAGLYARAWIDLEIKLNGGAVLDTHLIRRIRSLNDHIINIRLAGPENMDEVAAGQQAELKSLPLDELFHLFYRRQTGGLEPDPALVQLFLEIAAGDEVEQKIPEGDDED